MARPSSDLPLISGVLAGETRALARAATLLEARTQAGRDLISAVFDHTGRALILGVTGPPGAGKSTLVNCLIRELRGRGKTVAVIAVDPSSPYSRGAILGDRIRMQDHYGDPGVFIRSCASRGKLGGLALSTLELTLLFDAAGRDVVIVETVGVGQEEMEVSNLADVTALVLVPGMGDDMQVMKAGIMEIADVFVINKADLPGADKLEDALRAMQGISSATGQPNTAPIQKVVAADGTGVEDLLSAIEARVQKHERQKAREIWSVRLREMLRESLLAELPCDALERQAELVMNKESNPYRAVTELRAQIVGRIGGTREFRD